MKLAYQLWKSETGSSKKILFLHGMGGVGKLWRPLAASLEEECEVLAPDQRGHGQSQVLPQDQGSASYAPLDYGKDVIELLQTLNFHSLWIVGHSMGVRTACAIAHLRPDWVRGLVLIDLGLSGVAGGGLGESLAQFLKILPMEFENRVEARAFMNAQCPDPSIGQYLQAVSFYKPDGKLAFPFDKSALIQTIDAARDFSLRNWVKELAGNGMPILILRGEKSLVWSREEFEMERQIFSKFPSIVFEEFPGTGHGLPFEKRPEFVARLREFMGQNNGGLSI